MSDDTNCQQLLQTLATFSRVLAVKLYRLRLDQPSTVPVLPCLDHEAMLHSARIDPHAAAYVQDESGDLHELVFVPDARRIDVDVVSTMGENTAASRERFVATLEERFPGFAIRIAGPSWLRGDRRVAEACRAQVTLRDVLTGADIDRIKASVDRLGTISSLMEKESRVASWGARTVMAPLVAVVGFASFQLLGALAPSLGAQSVAGLRYATVGAVGAFFLYYGLKAVHLTEMANRVWKRTAEYGLILSERRRLGKSSAL
jgi:hypothetical protein